MPETLEEVVGSVLGLPTQSLSDDSSTENVQEWDSLRQLSIILALESAYGITITADQALDLNSISAIRALLTEQGVELPT